MAAAITTNPGTIKTKMKWVDLSSAKANLMLPHPWPILEAQSFHVDLVNRAYAHLAYIQGYCDEEDADNATIVLRELGEGFQESFGRSRFEPKPKDPHFTIKMKALDAFDELSAFYGDRISSVVWASLAHLACRNDPEREQSIIKEMSSGTLPYHYTLVDSMLHAVGLVYTFALHVNSVMFKHTGRILVHNCDCSCSLVNMEEIGGSIAYTLPRAKLTAATQSVFTHGLAETVKLTKDFLPFAYSITPEAREIKELL